MPQPQNACPTTTEQFCLMYILRYTWRPGQWPNKLVHSREEVILGLKSKKNIAQGGGGMPRGILSCPLPRSDQVGPEETRLLWSVLHLCARSPQLGQACAQIGMETALHRSHWAIHPLHQLLCLCHRRVCTAQGMLSVQIKVTTNWLFSKSLPGCSRWAVVGGAGAYSKTA